MGWRGAHLITPNHLGGFQDLGPGLGEGRGRGAGGIPVWVPGSRSQG